MPELTFTGFLKQYVKALADSKTLSLYKLCAEANSNNPRLREPLLLYAMFTGKKDVLLSATKYLKLNKDYSVILSKYSVDAMEIALQDANSVLPREYTKVYRSYVSVKNKEKTDAKTKLLIRNEIVRLQDKKKVSTYRIYTDLGVNHGNMNAYLKHGNCSKISFNTARKALEYMENY